METPPPAPIPPLSKTNVFKPLESYRSESSISYNSSPNGVYQYDSNNRITNISWAYSPSTVPLISEALTYDAAGNILTRTRESASYSYTYDPANQLTGVAKTQSGTTTNLSMAYDLNGNRTSHSTSGTSSFLQNFPENSNGHQYFASTSGDGSLAKEWITPSGASTYTTELDYDFYADDKLLDEVIYDANGNFVAATNYTYDPLRRSIKTYSTSVTGLHYDFFLYLEEADSVLLTKNTAGKITLQLEQRKMRDKKNYKSR